MSDFTLNNTLSSSAFYVLLAVADRPLHGYAVREQVAHDSLSQFILATCTVYTILARLVRIGLVERIDPTGASAAVTCRYFITERGRQRLEGEVERIERAAGNARYKLGESPFR